MPAKNHDIRELLKDHGLRYSHPREVILTYLLERDMHVSAEGLYSELKNRGEKLSLSTIYLNLNVLQEAGLVRALKGLGNESVFDSNTRDPHYHLICKHSGKVIDIPAIDINGVPLGQFLKEKIEEATGWQVEEPEFNLQGIAPEFRR